jgi:hypothetical protein
MEPLVARFNEVYCNELPAGYTDQVVQDFFLPAFGVQITSSGIPLLPVIMGTVTKR